MYFGQAVRGWMPTGAEEIQRIKWTGENPVAIKTMRLTDRDIRNIIAYVRQAFGANLRQPAPTP